MFRFFTISAFGEFGSEIRILNYFLNLSAPRIQIELNHFFVIVTHFHTFYNEKISVESTMLRLLRGRLYRDC